jgi:hypothetical protein
MDSVKTKCGDAAPTDIFPDGTSSFCYPLREVIKLDSSKYNDFGEVENDMIMRYKTIESIIELPEPCKGCPFNRSGECAGPCLGMRDLSGETIGRNL